MKFARSANEIVPSTMIGPLFGLECLVVRGTGWWAAANALWPITIAGIKEVMINKR